ncbi:MAG: leucine-rich repeat domain-containing protein [Clostridia bacterium]|nr:leucine-rich repeat domain-containing protein [Clostridia bacterium]
MKRFLLLVLSLAITVFGMALVGCQPSTPPHEHDFKEIAESTALKTEATCTHKAVYFKSCECGELSSDTFEYGETTPHDYKETVKDSALVKGADCVNRALYKKSCDCGALSSDTFEYGEIGTHAFPEGVCTGCNQALFNVSNTNSITGFSDWGKTLKLSKLLLPTRINGADVTSISKEAFLNCSSLTEVIIPESYTYVGAQAFRACTKLTKISLPNSLTFLGAGAFEFCNNLQHNVYNKAEYLGNDENPYLVLTYNNNNTDFHPNAKLIASNAFANFYGLTSIDIPDTIIFIGNGAFNSNSSLKSVTIPSSVTYIDAAAFMATGIESIVIPDSVSAILDNTFALCNNLKNIVIPRSVTEIGDFAFDLSDRLSKIFYMGSASDWTNINIGEFNDSLLFATRYYYSENEPTTDGNYWHYDENGEIEIWE